MRLSKLLGTIALGVMVSHVPMTVWAQDLPTLGTQAVNLDGQPIATETTVTGGFSVDTTTFQRDGTIASQQPVTIKGTLTVDPTHLGQTADIIVYVNYGGLDQPLRPETSTLLMLGMGLDIQPWNSDVTSLIPFVQQVQLQATQPVDIYSGSLTDSRLQIFFGYLLTDGTLVTNKVPISLAVETVPEAASEEAATASEEENLRIDTTPLNLTEDEDGKLVGWKELRWPAGSVLKVAFDFSELTYPTYLPVGCYNGMPRSSCEEAIANRIIRVASLWSRSANLYFKRIIAWDEADIRISFGEKGSYSRGLGTQLKKVPRGEHTMNFAIRGFLDSYSWSTATILHEFGHAIGLAHEHNSPNVAYTWNEAQVIADLKAQGWTEAMARQNVLNSLLKRAPRSAFFTTRFDPRSIMIYPIPKNWVSTADLADPNRCPDAATTINYCVASNIELSTLDKQGIAQFYPKGAAGDSCSFAYDPSPYRPGTPQWDGHTGPLVFFNPSSAIARVSLYDPETPAWYFAIWNIPAGKNALLSYNGKPFNIGMDWGVQVNDSPICIVKAVSTWSQTYFQVSVTRMPGM